VRQAKLNTPEKRARVGERIKVAATQSGLSLKELAQACETKPSMIYQYVRGITSIPPDLIERIAAVTRVHTDFFDPEKDGRSAFGLPADQPSPEGGISVLNAPTGAAEPATRQKIDTDLKQLLTLALAQNHPERDRSAYRSSLEQIYALSHASGNAKHEGGALWRLAMLKLEENDFTGAQQNFMTARDIFQSEGSEDNRQMLTLALADAYMHQGNFDTARSYLDELVTSSDPDMLYRTQLEIGMLAFRQHDHAAALKSFCKAAEQLQKIEPEKREPTALLSLIGNLADIVRAAGHYEEAIMLWSRCMQAATAARKADAFLESIIEIAQCCTLMGRIGEAKQRLELASVLAGFLFEDTGRLSIARALLADVLVTLGYLDNAKENARAAMRIANKVGSARPTIIACMALAETYLAAGQWSDALDYTQEALDEAKKSKRLREIAQIREMRSRAYLRKEEDLRTGGNAVGAQEALRQAFAEAGQSMEFATKSDSVAEQVSAHLALARCHFRKDDGESAEQEAHAALELTAEGGVGLQRLLGEDAENLPELMLSPEIDLPSLFEGRRVHLPALEWQALYIEGTLRAARLGPGAGFAAIRDAAQTLTQMLSTLTQSEAVHFQQRHPEVTDVFAKLTQFALSEGEHQETDRLLDSARWLQIPAQNLIPKKNGTGKGH
jgi:tetratricopeptide (TPR) repeat protein/transcriptional regulator with XRE-family HTH domain